MLARTALPLCTSTLLGLSRQRKLPRALRYELRSQEEGAVRAPSCTDSK